MNTLITHVKEVLSTSYPTTIVYQFQEKLKTDGITDLTLFTEKIDFDAEEHDLIVEEDPAVLEDTTPAVNYKEVMQDFQSR